MGRGDCKVKLKLKLWGNKLLVCVLVYITGFVT